MKVWNLKSTSGLKWALLCIVFSCGSLQAQTIAQLITPADRSVGVVSPIAFSWSAVDGAQAYYLYVGTAPGLNDAYNSGETQQLAISRGLSPGTYYARLWTKLNGVWYGKDSTFTVSPSPAILTSPASVAAAVTSPVSFVWNSVQGATNYYLYVGSAPGLKDIVNSGETEATQITRDLSPGTYYTTLWTQFPGIWMSSSSSFTVVRPAELKTPADNAVDVSTSVTFSWDPVPNAQTYYLYVGTAPGLKDVINSGETQQTSITRNLPPENTYYVTLHTKFNSSWLSTSSSFVVGESIAKITWPLQGAIDIDPMRPITWTSVPNAQAYYLYVGTQPGFKDVYESGETLLTSIAPAWIGENRTYFATLYTKKNNRWQSTALSFSTGVGFAKFISPSGEGAVDPESLLAWTEAPGPVDAYQLTIGTLQGTADVFDSGNTGARAMWVPGLAYGKSYFARITTKKYGTSRWVEVPFQTLRQENVPDIDERKRSLYGKVSSLTHDVRLMADQNNYPIDGTVLADWVSANSRTQALCNDYASVLKTELRDRSVLVRVRNITLNGNGYEDHAVLEFYDPFVDNWTVTDPTFGYIYWDPSHNGSSVEQLSAALHAGTIDSVPIDFVTEYGNQLAVSYYVDPAILFANYYAPDSSTQRSNFSPDEFLEEVPLDQIGAPGVYLFKLEDTAASVQLNGGSIVLPALKGTPFTKAVLLSDGWQMQVDSSVAVYKFKRLRF